MKKLLIGLAIASALGVSGCDDETIADIEKENNVVSPNGTDSGFTKVSRVLFDPAESVLFPPNDLLFIGTEDGTLNIPLDGADPTDVSNPFVAANALDGWSTIQPFVLGFEFADGVSLDPASLFDIGAVAIYEVVLGASIDDADCAAVPALVGCKPVKELVLTEDYFVQAMGSSLAIIPLKPLKPKTSYIVALTNKLKDTNGDSINASVTYNVIKQDIDTAPLSDPKSAGLQQLTNSYEDIAEGFGMNKEDIIYTMTMTTQSIQDVSQTVKSLMLSGIPGTTPILTAITPTGANAAYFLGLDGDDMGAGTVASFASVAKSSLSMPYYLETPYYDGGEGSCNLLAEDLTQGCPDLFSHWSAMGDSPVTVLGALEAGVLSQESFAEQAIAQGKDPAELIANPTKLVGLTFTVEVVIDENTTINVPVDQTRYLTKFNPLPQVKSYKTGADAVDVTVTMPDVERINTVRMAIKGSVLTPEETMVMPEAGWPTMIYSHGLTSYKETVLAIAGNLANAGIATISIDHPYHGNRGIDFNGDGVYEISATEGLKGVDPAYANASSSVYINLQSLLTGRDNVRQSEVDLLSLRLSLNSESLMGQLDASKVSFFGISWGAITGTPFMALANSGVVNPNTGDLLPFNPYQVNSASLAVPGGGLGGLLLESPEFGPEVMAALIASGTFQSLIEETAGKPVEDMTEEEYSGYVAAIYPGFAAQFNFAAQTVLDSSDPINYAATLQATMTPVHLIEVIGDEALGGSNLSDQVVINASANLPLVGTEPLIDALGLTGASDTVGDGTTAVSAALRFLKGHHSSALSPYPVEGVAEDGAATLAVTLEMQNQITVFAASGGTTIPVADNQHIAPAGE